MFSIGISADLVEQPGLSGRMTKNTECLFYGLITINPFSGKI